MSSSAFTPSTTTVTNNVPVNVPVVTAWEAYTPTLTGFGTPTAVEMYWRRNGDQLEVRGNFTTGTTTAVEARLSFPDASTTASAFPSIRIAGSAIRAGSSATYFSDNVLSEPSVSYFTFGIQASTSNGLTKALGSGFAATTKETIHASTTISQWAGSGTTTLATRAVEEYAWNSDTTNTSTTSSGFSNGPDGVQFGSYSTATRTKRVRFQTSILPTDTIILETKDSANSQWMPYHQSRYISTSGTTGMGCNVVSSTEVDVFFASAGYASTVYSPTAAAWSGIAGSDNFKWRVRKVSGGAQVGYPVSARNIVGDTSGTVVPTGMIGETITASPISSVTWGSTGAYKTIATLNLTAGVWLLKGVVGLDASGATWSFTDTSISTTTNALGSQESRQGYSSGAGSGQYQTGNIYVNVSSNTPYYLTCRVDYSVNSSIGFNTNTILRAIRIA